MQWSFLFFIFLYVVVNLHTIYVTMSLQVGLVLVVKRLKDERNHIKGNILVLQKRECFVLYT